MAHPGRRTMTDAVRDAVTDMRRWTDSLDAPAVTVREMLIDHDRRLDAHDIVLAEVRGGLKLLKWVFGATLIGTVATLWQLFGGRVP